MSVSAYSRLPRPSRFLSRALEDALRVGVFDQEPTGPNDDPMMIIPNGGSGCHAIMYERADGIELVFHHQEMVYASGCRCVVRGAKGAPTLDLPEDLDLHRVGLIFGINRDKVQMESRLAAMVVMKVFLGLDVPEVMKMSPSVERKMREACRGE
ncbi:hypothetical protein F4778DRAFT_615633 [Xylariomycetidae sp. FL2044]|nr:hypothetical protein F4778DRAFT_615633 [Xylariomycetidae sp. FL2044]